MHPGQPRRDARPVVGEKGMRRPGVDPNSAVLPAAFMAASIVLTSAKGMPRSSAPYNPRTGALIFAATSRGPTVRTPGVKAGRSWAIPGNSGPQILVPGGVEKCVHPAAAESRHPDPVGLSRGLFFCPSHDGIQVGHDAGVRDGSATLRTASRSGRFSTPPSLA